MGRTVLEDGQQPEGRPAWLTQGALRLAILCAFVALVEMASPRIEPGRRRPRGAGRRAADRGRRRPASSSTARRSPQRAGENPSATLGVLRHTGLPLLGLVFFLAWTILYIGLWWVRPDGAFTGLAVAPRFADFFYYAVSTGLISPPGDIVATSRGARAATLIEMISALAL